MVSTWLRSSCIRNDLQTVNLDTFQTNRPGFRSLKVRLRWFRAVLQDSGKHGVSLSSFNITIRVIYH